MLLMMMHDDLIGHAIRFGTATLTFNPRSLVKVDFGADCVGCAHRQILLGVLQGKRGEEKTVRASTHLHSQEVGGRWKGASGRGKWRVESTRVNFIHWICFDFEVLAKWLPQCVLFAILYVRL